VKGQGAKFKVPGSKFKGKNRNWITACAGMTAEPGFTLKGTSPVFIT
jgi:hypothetical protein